MISITISVVLAAMLLLLSGREAHGHMIMNTPAPYNLHIAPLLQVNPLSGDLYPFPCHNHYSFNARTPVQAGGATLVNFTGGAQHGGGSCQFSITYDEPVNGGNWNKSAQFKTIYSIIGGCPAVFIDETRNLPAAAKDQNQREDGKHCGNDSGIDCIRQFMIPIPKFLKNGPATFAWTWFNKIGNREMYMNCAPITITGGTGDQAQIDELPDIFVANYHNDPDMPTCVTGTSADKVIVNFPNPGKYGRVLQNPIEPASKPDNYCTQIPLVVPRFLPDTTQVIDNSTSTVAISPTTEGSASSTKSSIFSTESSVTSAQSSVPTPASTTGSIIPSTTTTAITPLPFLPTLSSSATSAFSIPALPDTPPSTTTTHPIAPFLNTSTLASSSLSSSLLPTGLPLNRTLTTKTTVTETITSTHFPISAFTTVTAACLPCPLGPGPMQSPTSDVSKPSDSDSDSADKYLGPKPREDAVSCEKHGKVVCFSGGMKWGKCNSGWAVPRDVARGTVCYWGRIVDVENGGLGAGV